MQEEADLFDTSEYPPDHFLFSTRNKKVLGKFKDEVHGTPVQEFVGLRPKMYSLLYNENGKTVEKKVAKGIAKNVTNTGRKNEFTSIANLEQIICKCHICLILLNFAT